MTAASAAGPSGLVIVDKPAGWTSHDVVGRMRRLAGTKKVGHAGTLDPMATGLLLLGLNSSTRLLTYLVGLDKEYLATIRLGASTSTDDAEGEVTASTDASAIGDEQIEAGIVPLRGPIEQVPSSVSAIKVDGKRAYALVRDGETVELKARAVTISAFEVLEIRRSGEFIDVDVRVECSSGTYIRALARDLGATLEVGGHLTALRRTRIGPFSVTGAATLEDLDPVGQLLTPTSVAAELFPVFNATPQNVVDLVHGKRIDLAAFAGETRPIAAVSPEGRLVGLLTMTGERAKPLINFPTDEVTA